MPTILLVEDELGIAEALEFALSDDGYRVHVARNGRDALEVLPSVNPDLILLDYMMPLLNGGQVLDRLAASPEHRELPVILMTAAPRSTASLEHPQVKARLHKPFPLDTLLDHVVRLIGPGRSNGSPDASGS